MTNEETYREFSIYFNGHPEHRLCVETDAQYLKRVRRFNEPSDDAPKHYAELPKAEARALVLAAVPWDHYRSGWGIARQVMLSTGRVSAELFALMQEGQLVRRRHERKWEYKRV